jgi:hypothetical protein
MPGSRFLLDFFSSELLNFLKMEGLRLPSAKLSAGDKEGLKLNSQRTIRIIGGAK